MKITINRSGDEKEDVILSALDSAGCYLQGARDLNDNGTYKAAHSGMNLHDTTVTLEDKYFADQPQSMETIQKAAEQAVGIEFQTNSFNVIVGYTVKDEELYKRTIAKALDARKAEMSPPAQGPSA